MKDLFLTVIIPTRNRADLLDSALESITCQTYPQSGFEVIVVDNGSTDQTPEIVKKYRNPILNLHYIHEPEPGLHNGRHAGLKASAGDILVYADDDIYASPTWLEGIAESFADLSVVLVGGNNLPRYESPQPDWVDKLCTINSDGKVNGIFSLLYLGNDVKTISPHYVFGCNFAVRKKTLLEVGGFHPDGMPENLLKYRGDGETAVSEAILKKGYRTVFNPKASVYHWVSTARMSDEYVYKRGYLQGISNSYTDIRKRGKPSVLQLYISSAKQNVRLTLMKIQNLNEKNNCPVISFSKGYHEGYLFHQKTALNDKDLIEWIMKDNYL